MPIQSFYPMDLVYIDFRSLEMSSGRYKHILVITDHFTCFAHAIPSKNKTANIFLTSLSVTMGFLHVCIVNMTAISKARSKKNSVKLPGLIRRELLLIVSRGSGLAEMFNRTLLNMLGTLEDHQKADSMSNMPFLAHAYKSTCHESTE